MHRIKWRICKNIVPTASAICGVKPEHSTYNLIETLEECHADLCELVSPHLT
jgi:hypothetical protein